MTNCGLGWCPNPAELRCFTCPLNAPSPASPSDAQSCSGVEAAAQPVAWYDPEQGLPYGWSEKPPTPNAVHLYAAPLARVPVAPPGFKLVPLEPTPEMLAAARFAYSAPVITDKYGTDYKRTIDEDSCNHNRYLAMLGASPAVPADKG